MRYMDEYELIGHSNLADCSMFLVELYYRPLHLHKELELILVLQGKGKVSVENSSFMVSAGDVLLFDSGAAHELSGGEDGLLLLALQVSRSFCKRFCPQLRNTRFHATLLSPLYTNEELQTFRQMMISAYRDYVSHTMQGVFRCMAYINGMFASLLKNVPYQVLDQAQMENQKKYEKRMRRILLYLEDHFREPVRLRELAEMEGLTETHLSHFFRDQLNVTFQEYLTRLRVEAAMYLLKTTDLSVTNISYECGFSDPKYLNQGFRKIAGISPNEWRRGLMSLNRGTTQSPEGTMQRILTVDEALAYLDASIN